MRKRRQHICWIYVVREYILSQMERQRFLVLGIINKGLSAAMESQSRVDQVIWIEGFLMGPSEWFSYLFHARNMKRKRSDHECVLCLKDIWNGTGLEQHIGQNLCLNPSPSGKVWLDPDWLTPSLVFCEWFATDYTRDTYLFILSDISWTTHYQKWYKIRLGHRFMTSFLNLPKMALFFWQEAHQS